jgi:hypothetical protein
MPAGQPSLFSNLRKAMQEAGSWDAMEAVPVNLEPLV